MEDPALLFNEYEVMNWCGDSFADIDEHLIRSFSGKSYSSYECDLDYGTIQNFNESNLFAEAPKPSLFELESPTKELKPMSGNNNNNVTRKPKVYYDSCATDSDLSHKDINIASSSNSFSKIISFDQNSIPSSLGSQEIYCLNFSTSTVKPEGCNRSTDFGLNMTPQQVCSNQQITYGEEKFNVNKFTKAAGTGTPSRGHFQAQNHVMAERKRRENLNQRFIALSALVPNLKKMDKASVLGEAIKHIKQLKEQVRSLEEQATRTSVESVVFLKRSILFGNIDHDTYSSEENSGSSGPYYYQLPLPEIEARVYDKDILIRVLCVKQKGCLTKIMTEIDKLHLTVCNSYVLTFGSTTLNITIIAQMGEEYCITVKDLVRQLRQALLMQ